MSKVSFGTISHGTLRNEDLLQAFADELERLYQLYADPEVKNCGPIMALVGEARTIDPDSEDAGDVVAELEDWLNEYAPPYSYFGALEGDGSDFGFWPCIESLEQAVRDGEVLKLPAGDEIPDDWEGEVMFVTDHGNVTFGRVGEDRKFVEEWSVV